MLTFINEILLKLRPCFSRDASFEWFVTIVLGFMLRSDQLGVTSVIRDLALQPKSYETMLHFFRASSWSLQSLRRKWMEIVHQQAPVYRLNGYALIVGDGVKQSKEGRFMPAVKKLYQESENSAKPEYCFGHMFGGLGVLIGSPSKWFCLPLSIRLHDGIKEVSAWKGSVSSSHVVEMVSDGFEAAKEFGKAILLLDRYFLSIPALKELKKLNQQGSARMELVTKAKSNCTAYELPPESRGVGRPHKKGKDVKVGWLFQFRKEQFQEAKLLLYGQEETVSYYCIDLLWGQKLYQKLRFVLVEYRGMKSILASTDVTLSPTTIIELYSYRFQIECCFRSLKQQNGGFCYHFWTKAMPKLNRYQKKGQPDPLTKVTDEKKQRRVLKTIQAIECHMMISVIAMGILQMASLKFSQELLYKQIRYLRTPSKAIVSEASVMHYLRQNIFRLMGKTPHLTVTQIITAKQEKPGECEELWVS